jgi:hypothetical protein
VAYEATCLMALEVVWQAAGQTGRKMTRHVAWQAFCHVAWEMACQVTYLAAWEAAYQVGQGALPEC